MTLNLRTLIERLKNGLAIKPGEEPANEIYDAACDVAYIHQI